MYYAIINGKKIPAGERLNWVKRQRNGVMVLCGEADGQGIVIDGETYHINGREAFDRPTADLVWEEETKRLVEAIGAGMGAAFTTAEYPVYTLDAPDMPYARTL